MSIFNFYCPSCQRCVDSNCRDCGFFCDMVIDRVIILEDILLDLKNIYDDCDDPDDLMKKVRLNKASAFDTALDAFDDAFSLDLISLQEEYDPSNLPKQFPLHFF